MIDKGSYRGRGDDPLEVTMSEMGLKPDRPSSARRASKTARTQRYYPEKQTLMPTSERATAVAARWISTGEEQGYPSPFNDIWLGNQIAEKVVNDPEIKPMLRAGYHVKVKRLLDKMVDLFWSEYVDDSVSAKNACSYFLDDVWDDLRYYAISCLTGAYLKQYGVHRPAPEYLTKDEQEMQAALHDARIREFVQRTVEDRGAPEGPVLDSRRKEVLRSLGKRPGGKS